MFRCSLPPKLLGVCKDKSAPLGFSASANLPEAKVIRALNVFAWYASYAWEATLGARQGMGDASFADAKDDKGNGGLLNQDAETRNQTGGDISGREIVP